MLGRLIGRDRVFKISLKNLGMNFCVMEFDLRLVICFNEERKVI